MGVVGFGGDGSKPAGLAGPPFIGPVHAGAAVRGMGGVVGGGLPGPGVVGVAGDVTPIPPDTFFSNFGVAGVSAGSVGVLGTSTDGPGVGGGSTNGIGVTGDSTTATGGYFSSVKVAQIHLEPHQPSLNDPNGQIDGRAGDLLAVAGDEVGRASLYFCRRTGKTGWVQLAV